MAFVKTSQNYAVGDKVKTTRAHGSFSGYFEVGTLVTVTDVGDRGYSIEDEFGHRVTEIGWII